MASRAATSRQLAGLVGLAAASVVVRRGRARALAQHEATPPLAFADDGVGLHVQTSERRGGAATVVFVHGYGSDLREWQQQWEALAPRTRLVRFDQRGHGRSGWGHHRRATLEQLGRDLRAVLEQRVGDEPVVLVGHSMGGMAVLALAGTDPRLFGSTVVGVALLSTSAGHLLEIGLPGALARGLRRTNALVPALWLLWFLSPVIDRTSPFATAHGRHMLRRRLFGRCEPRRRDLDAVQQDFAATRTSVLAAFAPSLLHHQRAAAVPVLAELPVLVLSGGDDARIPAVHSRRLADELGGRCELVVADDAGHMVNVTSADEVNAALARLLSRVDAGRPTSSRLRCRTIGRLSPGTTDTLAL